MPTIDRARHVYADETEVEVPRPAVATCIEPYLYVTPLVVRRASEYRLGQTDYVVKFVWECTLEPLDRPMSHSISCGPNLALAQRLAAATFAGAVHKGRGAHVKRDIAGATYVQCSANVMGKYLNADLNRLGF